MFKKIIILTLSLVAIFSIGSATFAAETSTDEYAEAKQFISNKISCQQLTDNQLEKIGDYYMEQMMPGQAHKNMEQALGGEGSESLRQAHIFMARRWYCGDAAGYGMMGMMGGFGPGMMGSGAVFNNTGYPRGFTGMMGNFGGNNGFNNWTGGLMVIFPILGIIFLVAGIATFIKYLSNKK